MDHNLKREYNYIQNPKSSGYRGIHNIFEYHSRTNRPKDWDGLTVEIQFRTLAQHAWATAVEIAGSITGHHSKFDHGEELQKEFFKLSSEIISRNSENAKSCYPNESDANICTKFRDIDNKIGLLRKLKAVKIVGSIKAIKNIAVIVHSYARNEVTVHQFNSFPEATAKYFELEKKPEGKDIVLVRGLNKENIRKAYQNYFSDTTDFLRLIEDGLKRYKPKTKQRT